MILGGALITQYKTKEEAEPARFKSFQNRLHRKLAGSVEYRGVVPEEDDSVSFFIARTSAASCLPLFYKFGEFTEHLRPLAHLIRCEMFAFDALSVV